MSITSCGLHLKDSFFNAQNRDIKRATTKVKDQNITLSANFLVKTICNSSGSWFIDNAQNIETSYHTLKKGRALSFIDSKQAMRYREFTNGSSLKMSFYLVHWSTMQMRSLTFQPTCVFGSLALRIIKISWHCHHSICYSFAKIRLSCFFHLCQHHG